MELIKRLIRAGYRFYRIPAGYAFADPLDGPDGVYLELPNLTCVQNDSGLDFIIEEVNP